MSATHHPSTEILANYSAGALDPGFGLVVAAHVESCAQCQRQIGAFEAVSGTALEDLPKTDLAPDALSRALHALDQDEQSPPAPDRRPLIERLPLKPKKWIAPGVWVAAVDTPHAPDNRVYVLRLGAGSPAARHAHSGMEYCTVLKGAYRDELGRFASGDFASAEGDFQHQPIVEADGECICLFATEGRLKPHGLIGSIVFNLANV